MKPELVITLSGYSRAGKTTLAEHLVKMIRESLTPEVLATAIGDVLKKEVSDLSGLDLDLFHNPSYKDTFIFPFPISPRLLLIQASTQLKAENGLDYFIRRTWESIISDPPLILIISDIRFRVELDYFSSQTSGALISIKITNPSQESREDGSEKDFIDNHDFDIIFKNTTAGLQYVDKFCLTLLEKIKKILPQN